MHSNSHFEHIIHWPLLSMTPFFHGWRLNTDLGLVCCLLNSISLRPTPTAYSSYTRPCHYCNTNYADLSLSHYNVRPSWLSIGGFIVLSPTSPYPCVMLTNPNTNELRFFRFRKMDFPLTIEFIAFNIWSGRLLRPLYFLSLFFAHNLPTR